MQALDCISGLHNHLEFSQSPSCLDEAMLTWKKYSIVILSMYCTQPIRRKVSKQQSSIRLQFARRRKQVVPVATGSGLNVHYKSQRWRVWSIPCVHVEQRQLQSTMPCRGCLIDTRCSLVGEKRSIMITITAASALSEFAGSQQFCHTHKKIKLFATYFRLEFTYPV